MKHLLICASLLFFFSCKNKSGETETPPVSTLSEKAKPTVPPAAPPLPANMSVPDLRNEVRKVLRMQLPNTYPEMRNGQLVEKGYSFDLEAYAPTGQPVWIIQEKLYNPETKELLTGGKYFLLWSNVDPSSFDYVYAENEARIGLVIRPKQGASFVFHPFAQELQDETKSEMIIGWYDRVQDATLARGLVAMKTLAENMGKWENE